MKKKTILVLSDHPLSPSGVGTQTRYMIEALLKTGRYRFVCLGGAMKHQDYSPVKVDPWADDWVIYPVDGYGNHEIIRSLLQKERPDALWFMTDPRFYEWLWEIENEVRAVCPMIYYHVWDNYPYPHYNSKFYHSNDAIVTISQLTEDIVATVAPNVKRYHLPHSVDTDVYKPVPFEEVEHFLQANRIRYEGKKIFFWNNRNAGRKQPATLLWWFKEFLDEVGHDTAMLIMHTDPKDKYGPDLIQNLEALNLTSGQVFLSNTKVPDQMLVTFYNIADCTINIPDAEGFGLSSLESLACGTPVISTMTGGLKEQVFDGEQWYGIGIEPSSKSIVGSQDVPYIYEDRISCKDFKRACKRILNTPKSDLESWGKECRRHIVKNFNFKTHKSSWVSIVKEVCEDNGSWESRRGYKSWSTVSL